MSRWVSVCVIAILAVTGAAGAAGKVDRHMVDLVASGKIKAARASWWGFDAEDSTDALQAAINSGAKRLTIDNAGKPWVVRPIILASGQTIVFSPGVEVIAKRGEFKGKGDCLFRGTAKENITLIGYGATLRMHRSDYDSPDYEKAEWRHVLSFHGCSNVKVYGLTLAESGGDGIYLGSGPNRETNKNVHIKDVTCARNYRQGISVITAEDLLIENTVMCDTAGTAPEAGIDFEPNRPQERLVNVVMRNCTTQGNKGDGYELYLPLLDATSEPVSIRIENCRSIDDGMCSVRVASGNRPGKAVKGSVEFLNCTFQRGRRIGVLIWNKPSTGCKVRFENCSILDAAWARTNPAPIVLRNAKDATEPIGGVEFDRCLVRDSVDRKPIAYDDAAGGVPVQGVSGTIILERGGKRDEIEVTPGMLGKRP